MNRAAAVVGWGAVTPVGMGVQATMSALYAGKSGVAPIRRFDASRYPVTFAAEVDIEGFGPELYERMVDRALDEAVATVEWVAGFDFPDVQRPVEFVSLFDDERYPYIGRRIRSTNLRGRDAPGQPRARRSPPFESQAGEDARDGAGVGDARLHDAGDPSPPTRHADAYAD